MIRSNEGAGHYCHIAYLGGPTFYVRARPVVDICQAFISPRFPIVSALKFERRDVQEQTSSSACSSLCILCDLG